MAATDVATLFLSSDLKINLFTPGLSDLFRKLLGEPVILSADIATPFGPVLHELATNAAKYGALSGEKGRVDLSCSLHKGNNERLLTVVWMETEGPRVGRPGSNGFGTQLIKQGIAAAKVEHEFRPEGIRCTIEFPLPPNERDG